VYLDDEPGVVEVVRSILDDAEAGVAIVREYHARWRDDAARGGAEPA
jgi:hypothetical protein